MLSAKTITFTLYPSTDTCDLRALIEVAIEALESEAKSGRIEFYDGTVDFVENIND